MENLDPGSKPEGKKVKLVAVPIESFEATVKYLQSRPFIEVAELLNSLSQNQVLEGTVVPKETQPNGEPTTN